MTFNEFGWLLNEARLMQLREAAYVVSVRLQDLEWGSPSGSRPAIFDRLAKLEYSARGPAV
jgi:hypothetical protein